jgi:hypothetical protein
MCLLGTGVEARVVWKEMVGPRGGGVDCRRMGCC